MISQILEEADMHDCASCIRDSFLTVANEFGFTTENAPTNPAFITYERLKESFDKGMILYGLFVGDKIEGCIAIERSKEDERFFIERLAVLPQKRHKGYGKILMDFAFDRISEKGGKIASIGIVDENKILKNWYMLYGFKETGIKKFDHLPFTVCFMEKPVDK
jgi:ribosomal protein S18 acetylase RimI-like enzyme